MVIDKQSSKWGKLLIVMSVYNQYTLHTSTFNITLFKYNIKYKYTWYTDWSGCLLCCDDENIETNHVMLAWWEPSAVIKQQSFSPTVPTVTLHWTVIVFILRQNRTLQYLIKHHGHFGHFGKTVGSVEKIRLPSLNHSITSRWGSWMLIDTPLRRL